MTSRTYHYTDLANSGPIHDGFVPCNEELSTALRYTAGRMQVDAAICQSYFRWDDQMEYLLLHSSDRDKYYIVIRWTDSDEPHYRPMDTPLTYDARSIDGSDVAFQYIIPTDGISQLTLEDRRANLPEHRFSAAAIRAMAANGIRGYKQYEFPAIWDLGHADSEAALAMLHDRVRAFWAELREQRQIERAQSLDEGRGSRPDSGASMGTVSDLLP